jgi:hypothetical protein
MSRRSAVVVCAALLVAALAWLATGLVTRDTVFTLLFIPFAFSAYRYWSAIRWTDRQGRWPEKTT